MSKAGTREMKGDAVSCAMCVKTMRPQREEVWWVEINGREVVVCRECRNQLAGVKERKDLAQKEIETCLD
jgi:hypothetical protein